MASVHKLFLFFCLLSTTYSRVEALFSGCDEASYYQSLSGDPKNWSRADLQGLLETTHQGVLPYTSRTAEDVWDALKDLDPGANVGTVSLIYALIDVPADQHGTSDTWNREHMWPKTRGVEKNGPDFTDVHHLRPADANVNSARGNKHYSACGIVREMSECSSPAHIEAASNTSADPVSFLPPPSVRGDIARAMFYMDVRYDGNDGGLDLVLTDCPSGDNHLGYLSQLLQWHIHDPVDSKEIARNHRVCERWQGNRNPFIDHEDLVLSIFGMPQEDPVGGVGYSCGGLDNDIGEPDGENGDDIGTCSGQGAGDVMVISMNSDNPDDVALVALSDLTEGFELYMTDNAWTGSSFRNNEGTLKLTIPKDGIKAGSVFGYGDSLLDFSKEWETVSGSFALSALGDTVLLYSISDTDEIVHLSAFSYSGDWMDAGLEESSYGTSRSALPSALSSGCSVALDHADNCQYEGITSGTKNQLQQAITTQSEWRKSNSARFSISSSDASFRVVDNTKMPGTNPSGALKCYASALQMYFVYFQVLVFGSLLFLGALW